MNLEEAIQKVIQGQREQILPADSDYHKRGIEALIRTMEKAPRNSAPLEKKLAEIDAKIRATNDTIEHQPLLWERNALQRILGMVRCNERGGNLAGLAY